MQCSAKSKRTGERCKGLAVRGRQTCRMHGGTATRGMAAPQTIHGRYSKALPTGMLDTFHGAVRDPDLLVLRRDIALVDTHLAGLVESLSGAPPLEAWAAAQATLAGYMRDRLPADLDQLAAILGASVADMGAWDGIGRALDRRQRMVESERKRLLEMQGMVTLDQLLTLVQHLTTSIRAHVADQSVLSAIQADLQRALGTIGTTA